MACTVETFRLRFPEFSDETEYSDARILLFMSDAQTIYIGEDTTRWCNKYDIAHCYLTAHLLTIGTSSEAGDSSNNLGAINNKSAGGVSVSRAISAPTNDADNFYTSTSYGQMYLNIRNTCFHGMITFKACI